MREVILKTKDCPFCGQESIQLVCMSTSGVSREMWLECSECGGRSGSVKVPRSVYSGCGLCTHVCDDAKYIVRSVCNKWDRRSDEQQKER